MPRFLAGPCLIAALGVPAAVAQPAEPAAAPAAEPAAASAEPGPTGIPVVKSRADYEALTPRDRDIFNRSRRPPLTIFADFDADFIAPAEIDGGHGDVSINRLNASFGPSFRVGDHADLALRFQTEWSFYDFDQGTTLLGPTAGEPFDDLRTLSLTPALNVVQPDSWNILTGGIFSISGEPGAEVEDSFIGGGFFAASHPVTSNLRLGFGAGVLSKLSTSGTVFFPIPIVEWWITEKLSLRTAQGAGAALAYQPAFGWEIALQSGFERREFRLDEDAPLAGGAVIDRAIPIAVALSFKPHPRFSITGRVGAVLMGELEFHDDRNRRVTEVDREAAVFGGVQLTVRF